MSRFVDVDRIDWRVIIPTNPTIAEEYIIHMAKKLVERQPTADVVEVVHGKWIISDMGFPYCSKCGTALTKSVPRTKYCSNCGARMDGAE